MQNAIFSRIAFLRLGIIVSTGLFLSFVFPQGMDHRQPVLRFTTDKEVDVTLYLVSSDEYTPLYYTTRLQSPVCMEDLCNPIDIEIEWDLLGDFKDYKEISGKPVTKFDHKPFTEEDHEKLKKILSDKESLLQDYKMEDLVDTTEMIYSEEIDGLTGATSKTFEKDIVTGAIYTCYTLWNFVNGEIDSKLLAYTESILSDRVLMEMIHSGKKNYLNFILEKDSGNFSSKVNSAIGSLIWNGDPIISVKAIAAVNDKYWMADSVSDLLADQFLQLANPVQNALIHYFKNNDVQNDYLSVFIRLLPNMRGNQRNQVYEIFKLNADKLNAKMRSKLLSTFKTSQYSMTAKDYELLNVLGIEF